ncbi:MAG: T9SS type A sorting domain-containing protein [Flavobacteriales bacterium]|nr:T9SS type A sorting domain-containing protein [Flavobacteriales bacterium]
MKNTFSLFLLLISINILGQNLTSVEFNNDGVYIDYGDINAYEGSNQFTYNFWIKPDTFGTGVGTEVIPIMSKWWTGNQPSTSSWGLFLINNFLQFNVSDGTVKDNIQFNRNFVLNEWNFVSIVFDIGTVKYYLNAHLDSTYTSSVTSINDCNYSFKIGDWYYEHDISYSTFDGNIDEVSIYNIALDSNKIAFLMDCKPDSNDTGLKGYWDFEENIGVNVNDYSVNNIDGVFTNGSGWNSDVPNQNCQPSGISELTNNSFTIYPNPANTIVTIGTIGYIGRNIQIYNSLGQLVFSGLINSSLTVISVDKIGGAGLYVLNVLDSSSSIVSTNKFMIE